MLPRSLSRVAIGITAGAGLGAVAWTATEYAMHRWVLHGPFGRGRLRLVPLGGLHRAHHREPLATSLPARTAGHVAIGAVGVVAAHGLSAMLPAVLARSAAAAWSAGYSTYEITHWNAHHRPARTAWGRRLRERHDRHHFGAPANNLGVTMSWWDHLLGTEASPASHPATAR